MIKFNYISSGLLICTIVCLSCICGCRVNNQEAIRPLHEEFYKKHVSCLNQIADSIFMMDIQIDRDFSFDDLGALIRVCDSCDSGIRISDFKRPMRFFKEGNREFVLFYPSIEDVKCAFVSLCVYESSLDSLPRLKFLDESRRWIVNTEYQSPCF